MFGGDLGQHRLVHIALDQFTQGFAAEHARSDQGAHAPAFQQPGRLPAGIGLLQPPVPARAEEDEGGGQGAGRDPGHDLEIRALAAGGPAVDQTGGEGPVGPAAGQGDQVEMTVRPLGHALAQLLFDLLRRRLVLDGEADVGKAHGRGRVAFGQAEVAARPAGAGRQQQTGAQDGGDRPHQAETHKRSPGRATLAAFRDNRKSPGSTKPR
ncbi:hypothetical protein D3C72_1546700 [compost metagenome]